MSAQDDVLALLTRQHREMESMLESLLDSKAEDERAALLARAGDELTVHVSAEEQVFYPAVKEKRTEDILLESLEEHLSLKRLLADLLALAPSDVTFEPKCKVLEEQTRHHHKEEEEHLFPKVKKLLDDDERAALGRKVRAHEDALRQSGNPRCEVPNQTDAAEPLVGSESRPG